MPHNRSIPGDQMPPPPGNLDIPEDIPLNDILKLHHEVSEDIEYRLCTSDNIFRKCYFNYLTLYKKIISKCRGQAPIAALASAYVQFGKDKNGNCLPILHNGSQIRAQPTPFPEPVGFPRGQYSGLCCFSCILTTYLIVYQTPNPECMKMILI